MKKSLDEQKWMKYEKQFRHRAAMGTQTYRNRTGTIIPDSQPKLELAAAVAPRA